MNEEKKERKVVVPGEIIAEGDEYLPGNETRKEGSKIISLKFGLSEESNNLARVVPLSGGYKPRRGNVIIGKIAIVVHNGWLIDIGNSETAELAFLSISEVPKYLNQGELNNFMGIGETIAAKIYSTRGKIELTIKGRGLGKIEDGIVFKINSNKVPRVIGKEGSMINLIKEKTKCNIMIGQNGFICAKGEKIEDELLAKESILFIVKKSFVDGLTDEVEKWFSSRVKEEPKEKNNEEEKNE